MPGWNIDDIDVTLKDSLGGSGDFIIEVAKGKIEGHSIVTVIGTAEDVPINQDVTIWEEPSNSIYTYLSAATTMYISSTSVSDTTQPIIVSGLDANYDPITGIAVLNGQTQVEIVNIAGGGAITFLRISGDMLNGTSSGDNLVGDVYVSESTALTGGIPDDKTKIKGFILAKFNISRTGVYTVPNGFTAFLYQSGVTTKKNDDLEVNFVSIREGGATLIPSTIHLYQNIQNIPLSYISFPEKSDFELRVKASNNNTSLASIVSFLLIDNNFIDL